MISYNNFNLNDFELKESLFSTTRHVSRLKVTTKIIMRSTHVILIFGLIGCASESASQRFYNQCVDSYNNEYRRKPNHKAMVAGSSNCSWSWSQPSTDVAVSSAMERCRSKSHDCYIFDIDNKSPDWVNKIDANGGHDPDASSGGNKGLEFLGLFLFGAAQGYAAAHGTSTPVIPYIPPTPSYSNNATGQPATHCVSLQQTSQGGMEIYNGCTDVVSVAWCIKGVDCNAGENLYSNLWNIGVGKSWPVSGSRGNSVSYAACMGADVLIQSRGDNQFVCRK